MRPAKSLTAWLIVTAACAAALLSVRDWPRGRYAKEGSDVLPPGPEHEALLRRMRMKDEVVDRLLEGDLSLEQAAARFRWLNEQPPRCHVNPYLWPGQGEGERLCRQVISWLEGLLQGRGMSPSEVEAALLPFERELVRLLAEKGDFDLPPMD